MCTRALWGTGSGSWLVGRSMDWPESPGTNLWAFPRETERENGVDGSLTWRSRYASLTASAHDLMTVDGFNEAGLAAHQLFLQETEYGGDRAGRPVLSLAVWLQYMLDRFSTVAEAIAWTRESQPAIVAQSDPFTGRPIGLHLALEDTTGDSAIIEYLDGRPNIHHDRAYTVMTNSPPYALQLDNLKTYRATHAPGELPGGTAATDRFVRAMHYLERLPVPVDQAEAIASMLSVMRNVSQPFRIPDPDAPFASQTQWRLVIDLTGGLYVFESTHHPNLVWADLGTLSDQMTGAPLRLDLEHGLRLTDGLNGDVSDQFAASAEFAFLPA